MAQDASSSGSAGAALAKSGAWKGREDIKLLVLVETFANLATSSLSPDNC